MNVHSKKQDCAWNRWKSFADAWVDVLFTRATSFSAHVEFLAFVCLKSVQMMNIKSM